ncbi:hypothetical protein [Noviherbaspirillum humi]|uniref:hypothetical protein n=1 Tax=Noviherbaspirillum humi TaxID=1688639 RepID=UPI00116014BE|nr:hypothetical protein [Noviherbaspirillum humi]
MLDAHDGLAGFASFWLDEQHALIESFRQWLRALGSEWFTLPPALVETVDGTWRFAFVLRKGDTVAGVFNHPGQAIAAIGDASLAQAFENEFGGD